MTEIIDGRAIAAEIDRESEELARPGRERGLRAKLAVVSIGSDPAVESYSRQKQRVAKRLGIDYLEIQKRGDVGTEEVVSVVEDLAGDRTVDGILVHTPIPEHLDSGRIVNSIPVDKDVDCASLGSIGLLFSGRPVFAPATAEAVVEILLRTNHPPAGRHVVILGRSMVVGKPLAALLLLKGGRGDATVTVCHSMTRNPALLTRRADIIVAAIGRAGYVAGDMVPDGSVVIDVGINSVRDENAKGGFRLAGDVDFEDVQGKAGAITPVPGGVGPVTTSVLMNHVARSFSSRVESGDL